MSNNKFVCNGYIEAFAQSDPDLCDCVKSIRDILFQEVDNPSQETTDAINVFAGQKAIYFDKYISDKKIQGKKSADLVTIIGTNEVLLTDIKLNVTTGYSIIQDNAVGTKDKYTDTLSILQVFPEYNAMSLTIYAGLVVILPYENFEQIKRALLRFNNNAPYIELKKINEFWEDFFQ